VITPATGLSLYGLIRRNSRKAVREHYKASYTHYSGSNLISNSIFVGIALLLLFYGGCCGCCGVGGGGGGSANSVTAD
jgi:hypothetical protein